jgi:Tol biopolymer transport system component
VKTSRSSGKDRRERRGTPLGWTWVPSINPVSVFVYLVLAGVVVLVIWRITGYQPLQSVPGAGATISTHQFSRTYVLLGVRQGKVYFFDRQAEGIFEYNPPRPNEQRQVGSLPSVEAVSLSPQRDKIALLSAGKKDQAGIYVLDLSGPADLVPITTREAGLTPGYTLRPESEMSWSPDGQQVAFVAYKGDQSDLFVAQPDGKGVQRLTYHGANVGSVVWVDQQTLAFVSDWEGQDMMYLIERDGGNLRRAR